MENISDFWLVSNLCGVYQILDNIDLRKLMTYMDVRMYEHNVFARYFTALLLHLPYF